MVRTGKVKQLKKPAEMKMPARTANFAKALMKNVKLEKAKGPKGK